MTNMGVTAGPLPEGPVEIVDNPLSPEFFAEGQANLFKADKSLIISLYSPRLKPDGTPYRIVVARIVMQTDKAGQLAAEIIDFLDQAKIPPSSA